MFENSWAWWFWHWRNKNYKKKPLKCLKKIILLPAASEKENKQASLIEIHEEDNPTSPKKNHGRPLRSNNNKEKSNCK